METQSQTATLSTTNADVVLDANVIVGFLDPGDVHHAGAVALLNELRDAGRSIVLLEFLVEEAISVLCRRARQRKLEPPKLERVRDQVRHWHDAAMIECLADDLAAAFSEVLDIVCESNGLLNMNDAKLVYLQRAGTIGDVASFDEALVNTPGMRCVERKRTPDLDNEL